MLPGIVTVHRGATAVAAGARATAGELRGEALTPDPLGRGRSGKRRRKTKGSGGHSTSGQHLTASDRCASRGQPGAHLRKRRARKAAALPDGYRPPALVTNMDLGQPASGRSDVVSVLELPAEPSQRVPGSEAATAFCAS